MSFNVGSDFNYMDLKNEYKLDELGKSISDVMNKNVIQVSNQHKLPG